MTVCLFVCLCDNLTSAEGLIKVSAQIKSTLLYKRVAQSTQ